MPKQCKTDEIINPDTNRCVKKSGKIGQELVRINRERTTLSRKEKKVVSLTRTRTRTRTNTYTKTKHSSPPVRYQETSVVPRKSRHKKKFNEVILREELILTKYKNDEEYTNEDNTSITLDDLKNEINNRKFIVDYVNSIQNLMTEKITRYENLISQFGRQNTETEQNKKKLADKGYKQGDIDVIYPVDPDIIKFGTFLESMIDTIRIKIKQICFVTIKSSLIDAIYNTEFGIESIVGREDIKNEIAKQIYSFSKSSKVVLKSFNNIAIFGSAGVGKTKLATTLGYIYSKVGILVRNNVYVITRTDLVGQYVGQTGPRTRKILLNSLESVIFVDEAYQLTQCPDADGNKIVSNDFGAEAVTELVNFLDKYIGLNILIVAGYEDLMKRCFMSFNEGLPRRFPYILTLNKYNIEELTNILTSNIIPVIPENILIDSDTVDLLYTFIKKIHNIDESIFNNQAGDMLNLSTSIITSINSSYKTKWINGNIRNNINIIINGFNRFLKIKNCRITF